MKTLLHILFVALMSFAFFTASGACGYKPGPKDASTVLSIVQIGCILAHEEVEDVKFLAEVCGIAHERGEDIARLIAARKEGKMQKAKLAVPSPSSSAPTPACPSSSVQ